VHRPRKRMSTLIGRFNAVPSIVPRLEPIVSTFCACWVLALGAAPDEKAVTCSAVPAFAQATVEVFVAPLPSVVAVMVLTKEVGRFGDHMLELMGVGSRRRRMFLHDFQRGSLQPIFVPQIATARLP
jgi:hypothetical protein